VEVRDEVIGQKLFDPEADEEIEMSMGALVLLLVTLVKAAEAAAAVAVVVVGGGGGGCRE
jgi:hypothetical protein